MAKKQRPVNRILITTYNRYKVQLKTPVDVSRMSLSERRKMNRELTKALGSGKNY